MSEPPILIHALVTHSEGELAAAVVGVVFQSGSAMKPSGALIAKLDGHATAAASSFCGSGWSVGVAQAAAAGGGAPITAWLGVVRCDITIGRWWSWLLVVVGVGGGGGDFAHFLPRADTAGTTVLFGCDPAVHAFMSAELIGVVSDEVTLGTGQHRVDTTFSLLLLKRTPVQVMDVAKNPLGGGAVTALAAYCWHAC